MKAKLEKLYRQRNRAEFIHPDPLELVRRYDRKDDIEVAGLIASSLAFGNVYQILKAANFVLSKMGKNPSKFIDGGNEAVFRKTLAGFKYRFVRDKNIASLFKAIKKLRAKYGSLEKCFIDGDKECGKHCDYSQAVKKFAENLARAGGNVGFLIPKSGRDSAFKRLNLFLRWMVRKDAVDTGCWGRCKRSMLIVPLDVHLGRQARALGLTKRKDNTLKTALEITAGFKKLRPDDPVKFDFALTRAGISKQTQGEK